MASPIPSGYHPHAYSHHESSSPHTGALHDPYSDSILHHPFARDEEMEQPLDLSMSRSPGPDSTEPSAETSKRPHHEEFSKVAPLGRSTLPGCLIKGCGYPSSTQPTLHPPQYKGHRHSPYPQYPLSGHLSAGIGEIPSLHPVHYPLPIPPTSLRPDESSSPYVSDRSCRSPYGPSLKVSSSSRSPYGSEFVNRGPSPEVLHSSSCSSTSPSNSSPRPSGQASPRPFYRPFEDTSSLSPNGTISATTLPPGVERYRHTSEDDLSASSSLLLLSARSSSAPGLSTEPSWRDYRRLEQHSSGGEGDDEGESGLAQHDSGKANFVSHSSLLSPYVSPFAPGSGPEAYGRTQRGENGLPSPANDCGVASSKPSADRAVSLSPKQKEGRERQKPMQAHFVTVVGTTPLSIARAERAKRHAEIGKERMKELLGQRKGKSQNSADNDSEGSSGQNSPKSVDVSEADSAQSFPIPPDPNLKISPLDYLLSEYLVQQRDVPFKPCNTEIREIYKGNKKGRLTLVDLIELQVEASLKA